ncbi:MAG: hypothetical protein DBY36_05520 [Clostridiales bacterium]|nr:MAG: hypothetical protein DBY36_05520 [Clostridiales bacterium]
MGFFSFEVVYQRGKLPQRHTAGGGGRLAGFFGGDFPRLAAPAGSGGRPARRRMSPALTGRKAETLKRANAEWGKSVRRFCEPPHHVLFIIAQISGRV